VLEVPPTTNSSSEGAVHRRLTVSKDDEGFSKLNGFSRLGLLSLRFLRIRIRKELPGLQANGSLVRPGFEEATRRERNDSPASRVYLVPWWA